MNKVPKLKGTERASKLQKKRADNNKNISRRRSTYWYIHVQRRFSLMINIRGTSETLLAFLSIPTPSPSLPTEFNSRKASFNEIDKFSDNIYLIKTYKSNFFSSIFCCACRKHKKFADLLGKASPNEVVQGVRIN